MTDEKFIRDEHTKCKNCYWYEKQTYKIGVGVCLAACATGSIEGNFSMCDPGIAYYRTNQALELERELLNDTITRILIINNSEIDDNHGVSVAVGDLCFELGFSSNCRSKEGDEVKKTIKTPLLTEERMKMFKKWYKRKRLVMFKEMYGEQK